MKKTLKLFASALGFIFLFYACRTDEMANSEQRAENEKIEAFEKFENLRSQDILNKKTHSSKNGTSLQLSYAQPFSEIIYQFLVKHPDFYDKLADDFGEIDYNVASQTFGEDKKYIFYPILKDGKVTSLWYGKLKEDRSWVDFYLVHDTSASTQRMIGEFQNYYSKKAVSRGEPDPPVKEIPEIVITPPSTNPPINDPLPNTGGGGTYTPPYTGDMSGGPIMHGGGTGTSTTPDPCKKTKSIMSKADVQAKVIELKNQSKIGSEIGVKIKADGTTTATIPGGGHDVELGSTAGYQGGYHNHTPTGIKMLSPPDIVKMMDFSMAQSGGNIQDGFLGMFGSEKCSTCSDGYRYYNYMINFSGTAQELAGFLYNNTWDLVELKRTYREMEKELSNNSAFVNTSNGELNDKGLEKLFFDTLKNMGMEGKVNLQKIEDNGTVQTITLNNNGSSTTATPCP